MSGAEVAVISAAIGAAASGAGAGAVNGVVEVLKAIKGRHEAKNPRPVNEIINLLDADIRVISCFMEDLKWKPGKNSVIKEIERQIGSAIQDGEDAIIRYKLYLTSQKKRSLQNWFSKEHELKLKEVASDAENVERRISRALGNRRTSESGSQADNVNLLEMFERLRNNLGETNVVADTEADKALQDLRRDVEANVVGFVQERNDLIEQLISGDLTPRVISLTGMVGAGKTTLAKKLYNDKQVISHFDCRAWIDLKKENTNLVRQIVWGVLVDPFLEDPKRKGRAIKVGRYFCNRITQIIRKRESTKSSKTAGIYKDFISKRNKILKEKNQQKRMKKMRDFMQEYDGDSLKVILSNDLEGKKYLMVFDDMWDTDTWNKVKDVLPAEGSKIIITTRINSVARQANPSPHFIRKLDVTESLELFCQQFFRMEKFEEREGEESERELVCRTLFKKNKCSQVENLAKHLAEACEGLPLSIVQLADHLAGTDKRRDTWSRIADVNSYLVEHKQLCRDTKAPSYHHLPQHLKKCFLYFGAFPKNYNIQVKQLIQIWIAEGFIAEDPNKNMEDTAEDYLERLIDENLIQPLTRRSDEGVKTCVMNGFIRELCMSEMEDIILKVHTDANLSSIDSKPRKLSLQGRTIGFMSSECHGLSSVHSFLCFPKDALSINQTQWKSLRQSIELVQVLNLGDVKLESIPEDIGDLKRLKYLKMKGANLAAMPGSISKLHNLLTLDLRGTAVNSLPNGIWKLENLRHLYLSKPTELPNPSSEKHTTFNNLQVLSCLLLNEHSVKLITSGRFPCVRMLRVHGKSHKFQTKIWQNVSLCTLTSLTEVSLVDVTMDFGLMVVLGGLRSLLVLKILRGQFSSPVETLHVTQGFVKLEILKVAHSPIENFIVGKKAMQDLRRLIIKECKNLKKIHLKEFASLKEVHGHGLSPELAKMLEGMKKEGCQFKIVIHPDQQSC